MSMTTPKIYVACLASYNNGQLHGSWMEADQSVESLNEEIQQMLAQSPIAGAEEWAIHDYEGFCSYVPNKYDDLETVSEVAAFIAEHGEVSASVLNNTGDLEDSRTILEEHYHGLYDSEEDFVENLFPEIYKIPKELEYYIDYEKMAKDWFISDYMSISVGRQVAVFNCV